MSQAQGPEFTFNIAFTGRALSICYQMCSATVNFNHSHVTVFPLVMHLYGL